MPDSSRPDIWHLCEDASNAVHSLLDSAFKDATHSCAQTDFDELENQELILSMKLTSLRACLDHFKGDYSAIQKKKQARLHVNRRLPLLPAETIAHILQLTCLGERMPLLECKNDVESSWSATIMEALRPREDIKYMFLSSTMLELIPYDYKEEALHHDIIATYPAKLSVRFFICGYDNEGKYSRCVEVLLQHSDRLRSLSIYCHSINVKKKVLKQCMRLLPYVKDFRLDVDPDDDWSFVTNHMSHLQFARVPSSSLASISCAHNFNNLTDLLLYLPNHSVEKHFSALAFIPNLRSLALRMGRVHGLVISHEELDASQIVLPLLTSLRLEEIQPSRSEALLAFFRKCRIQELALIGDSEEWFSEVRHFNFRRLGELFPQLTSLESDWHSDTVVAALSEPEDSGVWLFPALQILCLPDIIVDKSALIGMLHSRHRVNEVATIRKITVASVAEEDILEADHLLLYELNKLVPCVVVDFYEEDSEDSE